MRRVFLGGDFIFKSDFLVKQTSRDWVVLRKGTDKHGHFKTVEGCRKIIELICANKCPIKKYNRDCAKRLLTEEEFAALSVSKKQKYKNNQRRVRVH